MSEPIPSEPESLQQEGEPVESSEVKPSTPEVVTEKRVISDEERLKLAEKLDKELDEFMNGLERKPYTDGWSEDNWEEEIKKHPFFMKEAPKEGEELHPLLEGIQQLKYDPEENTKEELAENYKQDGTFYMKHKKFRMAIIGYTEGLKQKCENKELNAVLYNNRSVAHYYLRNYRSSLNDALKAVELNPEYMKSKIRAAHCYSHLERFTECQELCISILDDFPAYSEISNLLIDCSKRQVSVREGSSHFHLNKKHIDKNFFSTSRKEINVNMNTKSEKKLKGGKS